jgi:bifunctional non-homologous end joining protein LigD
MQVLPHIAPLTLTRLREPFDHPDWIFELKHDGFRGVLYVSGGDCKLVSRNANVFKRFPTLSASLAKLPVREAVVDGEIVCLDGDGVSIFNCLLFRARHAVLLRI